MKIVIIEGRQPFANNAPDYANGAVSQAETTEPAGDTLVGALTSALKNSGHEVDYVWLPTGANPAEAKDAAIAAALLYLEGTDRVIAIGFPANYVQHPNILYLAPDTSPQQALAML